MSDSVNNNPVNRIAEHVQAAAPAKPEMSEMDKLLKEAKGADSKEQFEAAQAEVQAKTIHEPENKLSAQLEKFKDEQLKQISELSTEVLEKASASKELTPELALTLAINSEAEKFIAANPAESDKAKLVTQFISDLKANTNGTKDTVLKLADEKLNPGTKKEEVKTPSALESYLPKGTIENLLGTSKGIEALGGEIMETLTAGVVTELNEENSKAAAKHAEAINKSELVEKAVPLFSKLLKIGGETFSHLANELPKIVSEKRNEITNFLGRAVSAAVGQAKANLQSNPMLSMLLAFDKPE